MDNEIEKYVQLTTKQRLKILAEQVATLVRINSGRPLALSSLVDSFRMHFGFALRPEQYDAADLNELVAKLKSDVQVCLAAWPMWLLYLFLLTREKVPLVSEYL